MNRAESNRRNFLKWLAASPLAARALAQAPPPPTELKSPKDAFSVMDFFEPARRAIPPGHYGQLSSGVDDNLTLQMNIDAYKRIQLRPHRLVDVSKIDTKVQVFGATWDTPIFLCPIGGQKAYNPEGEVAVARAANVRKTMQVLSTSTSCSIEDVAAALGTAPWFQLYLPNSWTQAEKLFKRVEAAGCPAIAWTIDGYAGRNLETFQRLQKVDTRDCTTCHGPGPGLARHTPMTADLGRGDRSAAIPSWSFIERMKKMTTMKVLVKGVDNGPDAKLAREAGVDGILLSNHGGRVTETLRATIDTLPEVIDAVNNAIPVMVDGGVRRGADVFKALASGARAVGIGRPYIYGLGTFGQAGVDRVLEILQKEFQLTMRQCGTTSISQITKGFIHRTAV